MIFVIVTPQTETFKDTVLKTDAIYINKALGRPKLEERNVKYAAPCWLSGDSIGVTRLYHILSVNEYDNAYELELGNSFLIERWAKMSNHRSYEYHSLESFGMSELKDGLIEAI